MENDITIAPKFETIFESNIPPSHEGIEKLKYWVLEFIKSGLMPCYGEGSYGNLSFRIQKGFNSFIVTASGLKADLTNDSFVEVSSIDFLKFKVYTKGARLPSSESILHYEIYKQRNDINAIFHGHCEEILNSGKKLGIPCTSKEYPYGTIELVNSTLKLSKTNNFFIMKNHGFISLGKDMDVAGLLALDFYKRSN